METKRSRTKYPGLDKSVNLRIRQELIDQDYISKLSDKEKKFLSDFNEESIGGNFNHSGKKLHKTKAQRKECYGNNNRRNRDVLSRATAGGYIRDETWLKTITVDGEPALIKELDKEMEHTFKRAIVRFLREYPGNGFLANILAKALKKYLDTCSRDVKIVALKKLVVE
jgi:hypothetical protein